MTADTITANHEAETLSDRELLERACRQLDHLDEMIHEVTRFHAELAPLIPLIPRALAFLDPGAAMRKHWKKAKGGGTAVQ